MDRHVGETPMFDDVLWRSSRDQLDYLEWFSKALENKIGDKRNVSEGRCNPGYWIFDHVCFRGNEESGCLAAFRLQHDGRG
jgi:hypothetical protein